MKVIYLEQGSTKWLEWRRLGVTATDAVILVGESPYKTEWRLWAEKSGFATEVDLSCNPLVQNGKTTEPVAREFYEAKHNDLLYVVCVEYDQNPILRASLDGLNNDEEPVELKCPTEKVFNEVLSLGVNSNAYKLHYYQVQFQILVTGAKRGHLSFYYNNQSIDFVIDKDIELHNQFISLSNVFYSSVKNKLEPFKDPEKDLFLPNEEEAKIWNATAENFRLYEEEVVELKKRLKELDEKKQPFAESLCEQMGDYLHADFCGVAITRFKKKGKIDYSKLISDKCGSTLDEAELANYMGKESIQRRVRLTNSVAPKNIVDKDVLSLVDDCSNTIDNCYF